ncbi:response regulator [Paractinoplanes rishiriensis]|uniref:DNA-binding response regulator n=1 Tax=Paractinoplanes rishiriensis TaxID=1050105 RepID=A0A919K4I5_9ACTN|nr:response regulator transcription factor [Actinoplanes rishiriensis]GIF00034.1 DNA-binding response regulator [Actinoplanes rishiriensis]
MSEIRVLIAEDEVLVRDSFRLLVDNTPGMVTVGEAGNGAVAVERARETMPDVVLMDVRMPGTDGIEATRQICNTEQTAGVHVLILTTFDLDEYVYAALRAGASGYLLKDSTAPELLAAIRVVASGEALLAPSATRRLIAEFVRRPARSPVPRNLDGVTTRERDVLALVGQGLSNTEIADILHLTVGTVKSHITHLLSKLNARDRAQLVIAAYGTGLVGTPTP